MDTAFQRSEAYSGSSCSFESCCGDSDICAISLILRAREKWVSVRKKLRNSSVFSDHVLPSPADDKPKSLCRLSGHSKIRFLLTSQLTLKTLEAYDSSHFFSTVTPNSVFPSILIIANMSKLILYDLPCNQDRKSCWSPNPWK
jgi:hypothetical protein